MTLSNKERDELEALGPMTVRIMLVQGGPGRGASIAGFKCGEITKGDIDDWLIEKETAQRRREFQSFNYLRWTFYAAVGALIAALVGILVTVIH